MSLATPKSVQELQTALHGKAKEASGHRFHSLYDKVYRKDILLHAYLRCHANGGPRRGANRRRKPPDGTLDSCVVAIPRMPAIG